MARYGSETDTHRLLDEWHTRELQVHKQWLIGKLLLNVKGTVILSVYNHKVFMGKEAYE